MYKSSADCKIQHVRKCNNQDIKKSMRNYKKVENFLKVQNKTFCGRRQMTMIKEIENESRFICFSPNRERIFPLWRRAKAHDKAVIIVRNKKSDYVENPTCLESRLINSLIGSAPRTRAYILCVLGGRWERHVRATCR